MSNQTMTRPTQRLVIRRRRTVADAAGDVMRWALRHPTITFVAIVVAAVLENAQG
jgi:hypothetical protein